MPFLFLLYMIAFLDRVNISYAALDMTRELRFSNEVFGFGAGIFFFGYFLLEIPGTILVELWSARKWIARIMISWGLIASLTGLIHSAHQFYTIRFVLGLAEAGFFPGIIVYLSHWFRYEDRGKAVAMFMGAIPLSQLVGGPLSGLLMKIHWFGLSGWRWLLILEGIPAVLGGIATLLYLTDYPRDAHWLRDDEREWITGELEGEKQRKIGMHPVSAWRAIRQKDVALLALGYFLYVITVYGFVLWLPKIVQKFSGLGTLQVTLVSAIPWVLCLPAMVLGAWHSDHTRERRWHCAVLMFVVAVSLALSPSANASLVVAIVLFSIAQMADQTAAPIFWALPTTFLSEASAAACIGLVNSFGNLGGFVGPYAVGYLSNQSGSYTTGIYFLAGAAVLCALTVLAVRDRHRERGGSA